MSLSSTAGASSFARGRTSTGSPCHVGRGLACPLRRPLSPEAPRRPAVRPACFFSGASHGPHRPRGPVRLAVHPLLRKTKLLTVHGDKLRSFVRARGGGGWRQRCLCPLGLPDAVRAGSSSSTSLSSMTSLTPSCCRGTTSSSWTAAGLCLGLQPPGRPRSPEPRGPGTGLSSEASSFTGGSSSTSSSGHVFSSSSRKRQVSLKSTLGAVLKIRSSGRVGCPCLSFVRLPGRGRGPVLGPQVRFGLGVGFVCLSLRLLVFAVVWLPLAALVLRSPLLFPGRSLPFQPTHHTSGHTWPERSLYCGQRSEWSVGP